MGTANQAPVLMTADNGTVTTDFGSLSASARSVVLQADGKIVVTGYAQGPGGYNSELVRYNADGSVDSTFGIGGIVSSGPSSATGSGVALQADGKIVAAGQTSSNDFALTRYNSNGSFDTSFGTGGKVVTHFGTSGSYGVVIQADGKIVLAGGSGNDFAVARYETNGNLDASFGVGGEITTSFGSPVSVRAYSLTSQPDGKLIVAGIADVGGGHYDFALARYNNDGSLDTPFGTSGKVTTDFASSNDIPYSVTLQADGKILISGFTESGSNQNFGIVRYNADGSLDTSFGNGGKVMTEFGGTFLEAGESVTVDADGKIVVAGYSSIGFNTIFALARYNSNGSLDPSFGSGGKVTTDFGPGNDGANSVVIQPDGRIVVVGTTGPNSGFDYALARYNSDGSLDTSFGVVAPLGGAASFTEGGAAAVLNPRATVHDADLDAAGSYAGASLMLARHGGADAQDKFGASGNLAALTAGGTIVLSGVAIGTVTQNSGGTLVLTFGANATGARVNEAMRDITYSNSSDNPAASVQVDWSFSDGNTGAQGSGGALAAIGSTAANIAAVNDAPTITIQGNSHLDAVTAHYGPSDVGVLLGNGLGGFSVARAGSAGGTGIPSVAVGDLNRDGRLDIVTANEDSNTIGILIGDGRGGFAAGTTGIGNARGPSSVAVGDVNGDGKPDIVTANTNSNNVSILIGDGGGGFTASTSGIGGGGGPFSVALGDINGDGKLDAVTANIVTNNVSILLGDGHGAFTPGTASVGGGAPIGDIVALGDLNGDGKLDIVTVNNNTSDIRILIGNGQGGFTASTVPVAGAHPISVALGDLNGDGKLDIVTANNHLDNVGIFTGDGHGGFTYRTVGLNGATAPESVALGDVDGDGKLDIITANGVRIVSALINDGQGGFVDHKTALGNVAIPGAVALGDFDTAQVASEDTDFVFSTANGNAIAVADADAGSGIETVSLSVLHGRLQLASGGVTVTGGANGSASVTFSGTIAQLNAALDGLTYRGVQDYNGQDTLAVTVNDNGNAGTGGALTAVKLVPINITAVNDAPVANNDSYSTSIGTTLTIAALGVLGNDTDQDGNRLTVSSSTNPGHGTLEAFSNGSFIYRPDSGYTGPDSFTYFANDGTANSASAATVSITVNPVPGSIVIGDQTLSEGDTGTQTMTFTVTRSGGTAAFDVNFTTFDNSATVADGDYVAAAGTLHFDANVNSKTIPVTINGDSGIEADETFFVRLTGATDGATIGDGQGLGTITNNDTNRATLFVPITAQIRAFAPGPDGWSGNDKFPRELADVNGDGNADIVGFGGNGVYVSLAKGDGSFGPVSFKLGEFGTEPGAGSWSSDDKFPRLLADVNGDGMADVVGFGGKGVYVSLATGNGSFGPVSFKLGEFGTEQSAGSWSSETKFPRELADVNGDGMADIVGFGGNGVYVSLATGGGSFGPIAFKRADFGTEPSAGGWVNDDKFPRQLADVNGDGKADIVGFGGAGVYVSLATGGGSFGPVSLKLADFGTEPGAGSWKSNDQFPRELADVNGDGKVDIVGFGGLGVYLALGNGDGSFNPVVADLQAFGSDASAGGWFSEDRFPRHLGDVNHDGAADIVGFGYDGVYEALSHGFHLI